MPAQVNEIFSSVVCFDRYLFANIEGQGKARKKNIGIIYDVDKGLILAPRDNITFFNEIIITIASTTDIKASIVF